MRVCGLGVGFGVRTLVNYQYILYSIALHEVGNDGPARAWALLYHRGLM